MKINGLYILLLIMSHFLYAQDSKKINSINFERNNNCIEGILYDGEGFVLPDVEIQLELEDDIVYSDEKGKFKICIKRKDKKYRIIFKDYFRKYYLPVSTFTNQKKNVIILLPDVPDNGDIILQHL